MFTIKKSVSSNTSRLSNLSKFVTSNKVSCRPLKTASFSRETKSRLGFVLGGGFTLGIYFSNKFNVKEKLGFDNFKPASVLASSTPRDQFNSIADILEDKSLGIVAIDSW